VTLDGSIRLLVVDDHELFRSSLSIIFELLPGLTLVGQAGSGQAAVELCGQLHPDLVLMDLLMPGVEGLEATRLIHERYPDIRILIYTGVDDYDLIRATLAAGAVGFVQKYAGVDALIQAIQKTCEL
jgi:DNA-binding NarL/FixJ family response regulator